MLGTALHLLLAPAIASWLRMASLSWRQLPNPGERQRAFAPGPTADRVLLVGSGIAVGFGVSSAGLALGGYLARGLSDRTRRGTSVETVARFGLRVRDTAAVLHEFDLERFDAVVLTLGPDEALHLATAERFGADLATLLTSIDARSPRRLRIVVVGIPDVTAIMNISGVFASLVRRHCRRLDLQVKHLCADHPRVTYVPFDPQAGGPEHDGGRHLYASWAAMIAPTVARVLDAQLTDPRDPATILEGRRQTALDDLEILDTANESRYDRIVEDARDLFGVDGASITFIDRDRQWSKSTVGMSPVDSPRGSALGDATVHNGKLFVVEDASIDPRYLNHPWVAGSSAIRFFAGFPIESSSGERVGALCITDTKPRRFTSVDDTLLGMLARRVETELKTPS
jgi:hypothetical protein